MLFHSGVDRPLLARVLRAGISRMSQNHLRNQQEFH